MVGGIDVLAGIEELGEADAPTAVDALAEVDSVAGTRFADRYRERRADREFENRPTPTATAGPDTPDHVVVAVVDCLRADALDASTPFLDGLDGTDAVAPSTWTFPTVTSLVTGRYPNDHGAIRRTDDFENSVADVTGLPPQSDALTLPERFAGAGYDTYGGFGMVVPFLALSGRFRLHRLHDDASADEVLRDHLAWLRERRMSRTFSYLHLADLHEPVDPPKEYWQAHGVDDSIPGLKGWRHEDVVADTPAVERYRDHRRELYRAAVEYVDNRLAAYHRRASDLLGNVALVVAGDHGEGFWERATHAADAFADPRPAYCVGHGGAPYEVVTRVPLRASGLDADLDTGGLVSLVDLAPTLADAAGLEGDAGGGSSSDGVSAGISSADDAPAGVSLLDGAPDNRTLLVESARYGYEKKAAYAHGYKLMVSRGDDYAEGFAVPEDKPTDLPGEVESDLRAVLPRWPDGERVEGADDETPSRAVERRLADLGYR